MPNNARTKVSLLQWNCCSIRPKRNQFLHLLDIEGFDIFALSETWLRPGDVFNAPGYHIERKDRVDGYGGVMLGIRHGISYRRIQVNSQHEVVCCFVEVPGFRGYISSLYSPPNGEFTMAGLRPIFGLSPGVILGDFNAHSYTWGPVHIGGRSDVLEGLIEDFGMAVLNSGAPTRCPPPPISSRAPDVSLCTLGLRHSFTWEIIQNPHGSDHLPIKMSIQTRPTNTVPVCRTNLTRHINWEIYSGDVVLNLGSIDDTESPVNRYDGLARIFVNSALTSQTRRLGQTQMPRSSSQPKEWWDNECTEKYREKGRAFREYRRLGTRELFFAYRRLEGELNRLLARKKRVGWKNFCSSLTRETSLSTLWSMGRKYRGVASRVPIPETSWLEGFASELAPAFAPPSPDMLFNLASVNISPIDHLTGDFTMREFDIALAKCHNTSAGMDLIGIDMVRNSPVAGKVKLLGIFNDLVRTETVPNEWYKCRVVPVPKPKVDPSGITKYRPICLLSCVRKLLEKMLHTRLEWWLEHFSKLSPTQYGFRRGVGTANCLASLSACIYRAFAQKSICMALFIDIEAAYDRVNIGILCQKMANMGVPAKIVRFLHLLMYKRELHFSVNGSIIMERTGYLGLPQGSVLSPLLFCLYTHDVDLVLPREARLIQYADDSVVATTCRNYTSARNILQDSCNSLVAYFRRLGLNISATKTELMIFTWKHNVPNISLSLNGSEICCSSSFKYLGVYFDPKLTWKIHTEHLIKKCSRRVNFMRSVAGTWWGADPGDLLTIYKSTVRSVIEYGAVAILPMADTHMLRLQRVQWRAIRCAMGFMRTTHTATLEVLSGIPPVRDRLTLVAERALIRFRHGPNDAFWSDLGFLWREKPLHRLSVLGHRIDEIGIEERNRVVCYDYDLWDIVFPLRVSMKMFDGLRGIHRDMYPLVAPAMFAGLLLELLPDEVLYTDGSRIGDRTGGSFYLDETVFDSFCLDSYSSVYSAEMVAIYVACRHILVCLAPGRYVVASDSLSSIQKLGHVSGCIARESRNVLEIRKMVRELGGRGYEVILVWVPSHSGIEGNEKADGLARAGAASFGPSQHPSDLNDYSSIPRTNLMARWQSAWDSGEMGRFCYSIIPGVSLRPWFRRIECESGRNSVVPLGRIISNHVCLGDHLNRVNMVGTPLCIVCNVYESIDHCLFSCSRFQIGRNELLNALANAGISPPFRIRDFVITCPPLIRSKIVHFMSVNGIRV